MKKTIDWFITKKLLFKDRTIKNLAGEYMKKARNNIITMELLSNSVNFKDKLSLPFDYDSSEWVVIAGYYSMYIAALGVLAKIGYKSKNHSATIVALEEFFVKKKLLDKRYIEILNKIKIKKEDFEELNLARNMREIAQYSVTKETTKRIAIQTKKDANYFVDKMEELFYLLE